MVLYKLKYSRNQVNRAGRALISSTTPATEIDDAVKILSNWRACHNRPINTFSVTLRKKLRKIDPKAIVAQRLKRQPSIVNKLKIFPAMNLARMQDIGGLRAVCLNLKRVRLLEQNYKTSQFKHELVAATDYIATPKESGYRSIHLVYRYKSASLSQFDGLLVELQIRTQLQHAWATAVETMGSFLGQALKSSQGGTRWLDFFSLIGSAFAHIEKTPLVPGYEHQTEAETFKSVAKSAVDLKIRDHLQAFSVVVDIIHRQQGYYHLLVVEFKKRIVTIESFGRRRLDEANEQYALEEKRIQAGESIEVVLVSAGPLESLRRAYPNYFFDTKEFVRQLDLITKKAAV